MNQDELKNEVVALPVTEEQLNSFVKDLVNLFGLPDTDDTYETICTMIMHMPQTACRAPRSFFGDSVLKSMTNQIVFTKLREFSAKRKQAETPQAEAPKNESPVEKV